jgi:beta-phosphoglucomutase-like phosphatase (HAD superfamily)
MHHIEKPSAEIAASIVGATVTAVLWDIDGTLLTSGGAIARTFLDAVHIVCGTRPNPAGLDFGGRLDPEIAALLVMAAGGQPSQVGDVLTQFESLVAARAEDLRGQIQVLPGVRHLVGALTDAGITQTVVTGTWKASDASSSTPLGCRRRSMWRWEDSGPVGPTGRQSHRWHWID